MQWLRDPSKIDDEKLRADVEECLARDEQCGPEQDVARQELGRKYELLLEERLRTLGVEFLSEDDLRRQGKYKTPDVLLSVPIGVDDKVVCWIDSKAKFGDLNAMKDDYKSSIASYTGRYGPGLVVYWFGFLEDAASVPMALDQKVHLTDRFPTADMYLLPGTVASAPVADGQDFEIVGEPTAPDDGDKVL